MAVEMQPEFVLNVLRRQCLRGSKAFKKLAIIFDALYILRCEKNEYNLTDEEKARLEMAHEITKSGPEDFTDVANEQFDVLSQVNESLSVIAGSMSMLFSEDDIDG